MRWGLRQFLHQRQVVHHVGRQIHDHRGHYVHLHHVLVHGLFKNSLTRVSSSAASISASSGAFSKDLSNDLGLYIFNTTAVGFND